MIVYMVLPVKKSNTELNACGIIASSNVTDTSTLEPTGDKRKKVP